MQDFGQFYSKQVAKVKTNIDILDVLDDLKEIKGRRYANAFLPMMDSLTWSIVLTIDALLDSNLINKFKASIPLDIVTLLDSLRGHWEKTDHNHYRDKLFAHFIERKEGETFHYMEQHGRLQLDPIISGLEEVAYNICRHAGSGTWVTEWKDINNSFENLSYDIKKFSDNENKP